MLLSKNNNVDSSHTDQFASSANLISIVVVVGYPLWIDLEQAKVMRYHLFVWVSSSTVTEMDFKSTINKSETFASPLTRPSR